MPWIELAGIAVVYLAIGLATARAVEVHLEFPDDEDRDGRLAVCIGFWWVVWLVTAWEWLVYLLTLPPRAKRKQLRYEKALAEIAKMEKDLENL